MYHLEIYAVFPVPTGMNRLRGDIQPHGCSVPRAHGDEPVFRNLLSKVQACSPCPRG